jgi:signal peptidase I
VTKRRAMVHRGGARRDLDEDDPDEEEEEEEEDEKERKRPRRRPRHRPSGRPAPVRRWRASGESDTEEEPEGAASPFRKTVFWRARDSLYFEPLVALAVIVLLLVGLFAYTQNWPPVYVVESDSMQHGSTDILGLINTGDLVLAQKVSNGSIVPYVVGLATGYSTYGEYGDVILYHPNGGGTTPIIHRAILFLVWNSTSSSYSAPDLGGLPCGNAPNAVYATPGTPGNCATTDLTGTLDLYHVGWRSVNVSLTLTSSGLGSHSGYLTMGDNNFLPDQSGSATVALSSLVEPGWIIGVARGMIPWFGAVKLLLEGQAGMVPPQSWEFLGLTIAGVILLAFGIHYALRYEGFETPLRRREEEEARVAEDEGDEEEEEGRARRWMHALRPWHRASDDEDEEEEPPRRRHAPRAASRPTGRRGRPRPQVRRNEKRSHPPKDDEL